MNRFLLVVLTILFLSSPAFSQEPENLSPPGKENLSPPPGQDSLPERPVQKPLLEKPETNTTGSVADTTGFKEMEDTASVEPDFSHSSSRATMLALVLPGLGQAYNQKYFKIPIVWGAIAGAGYAINLNTKQYKLYLEQYALDLDDTTEKYVDYWKRNMELSYIAMVAVYALQVLDAYVDAQLYSWDVSENLSMGISPSLQPLLVPGSLTGQSYGLTCSFNLRKK